LFGSFFMGRLQMSAMGEASRIWSRLERRGMPFTIQHWKATHILAAQRAIATPLALAARQARWYSAVALGKPLIARRV